MPANDDDEIPGAVEIGKSGQPVSQPPKKKRGRPPGAKNKPKQPAPANDAAPSPVVVPAVVSPPPVAGNPPVQAPVVAPVLPATLEPDASPRRNPLRTRRG